MNRANCSANVYKRSNRFWFIILYVVSLVLCFVSTRDNQVWAILINSSYLSSVILSNDWISEDSSINLSSLCYPTSVISSFSL